MLAAGDAAGRADGRLPPGDARCAFARPAEAAVPFVDMASGERWAVQPSRGRLPFWLFRKSRRVPGTRRRDYLEVLRLRRAPFEATVAEVLDPGSVLFRRLWEPVAV